MYTLKNVTLNGVLLSLFTINSFVRIIFGFTVTMTSNDIMRNFQWNVSENLYNSDHYPTIAALQQRTEYRRYCSAAKCCYAISDTRKKYFPTHADTRY